MKHITRKTFSLLLAAAMLAMLPAAAEPPLSAADESGFFEDCGGHWGEAAINRWAAREIIIGSGGLFWPDKTITRAEYSAIVDRMIRYRDTNAPALKDVKASSWYYDNVRHVVAAGVVETAGDMFFPNEEITRQEAIAIFAKAFGVKPADSVDTPFPDEDEVDAKYLPYVRGMQKRGYIQGGGTGALMPKEAITRAAAITMIDNIFKEFYHKPGVYAYDKVYAVNGNALINCAGVTLKNVVFEGDLYITEGVAGEITLDDAYSLKSILLRGDVTLTNNMGKLEQFGDPAALGAKLFRENYPVMNEEKLAAELTALGALALDAIYKD